MKKFHFPNFSCAGKTEEIRFFLAGALGLLFGYLLWRGIVTLPVEWVMPAALSLAEALRGYENDWARNAAMALAIILMGLPNTILIAALATWIIRLTQQARALVYASLVWPILWGFLYWFRALRASAGLSMVGMDPLVANRMAQIEFAPKALYIFVVYSLYMLLAFIFSWLAAKYLSARP